eukprot:TRINITY_DN2899_c0_g2_i1.p1 TRINITY_DN2899_c0_g2~~TRINITY_DN2899_c0_g2_i1.p1  ORF type:complete len:823 (-),score=120.49 TRINITY_DN2899_c0_g2_i1:23-2491(-)
MQLSLSRIFFVCILLLPFCLSQESLHLETAVIVHSATSAVTDVAVNMLQEEVYKRTSILWPISQTVPQNTSLPLIVISRGTSKLICDNEIISSGKWEAKASEYFENSLSEFIMVPEGYRLCIDQKPINRLSPILYLSGNDDRGVLFGVGRILRELHLNYTESYSSNPFISITIPSYRTLNVASAPMFPLRIHMVSYRSISNSYDAWTPDIFEAFVRDLIVWGTNGIEFVGPDYSNDPHFFLQPIPMASAMSIILHKYGLNVSVWYPFVNNGLWSNLFSQIPYLDSLFVPSGDPGSLSPVDLINLVGEQVPVLFKYHPNATVWLSCQEWNMSQMIDFYNILDKNPPSWLTGVVYGPHTVQPLPTVRSKLSAKFPLRHYPDLCHGIKSQFLNPYWDSSLAFTEEREVINPRAIQMAEIIRLYSNYTIGFGAYSDGTNDDVNKIIWSALHWDLNLNVKDILREYTRYLVDVNLEEPFSNALLELEINWVPPLKGNSQIPLTLQNLQDIEQRASAKVINNWRFQQAMYRAYYDAYVQQKLLYETETEQQALSVLSQWNSIGTVEAITRALDVLSESDNIWSIFPEWRTAIFSYARALYSSIGMQLSVPLFRASDLGRGANLDSIDVPLNNRRYLRQQFKILLNTSSEKERTDGILEILHWNDPGPGGFYDNLGDVTAQPHLLPGIGVNKDPSFYFTPAIGYQEPFYSNVAKVPVLPLTWYYWAETFYGAPLELQYNDLDPSSTYIVRIVYSGDQFGPKVLVRLMADDTLLVHDYIEKPSPPKPLTFKIPNQSTSDGKLKLTWNQSPGIGGSGRGCQVAEVWLIVSQ